MKERDAVKGGEEYLNESQGKLHVLPEGRGAGARDHCCSVLQAMRIIAERYLDRAVPVLRTSPDEVEFAVEKLDPRCRQLEGELGTYRPVSFLSRDVQV